MKSHVPVDIMDRSVKRLVNVRMERSVMPPVDTVHVSQDGEGRSVIDVSLVLLT